MSEPATLPLPDVLSPEIAPLAPSYLLEAQVGFVLRQVHQRHTGLFAAAFRDEFTPTQWAALAKLHEVGACSQNLLGRLIAVDVATIKGVVQRLARRGLVTVEPDPADRRRFVLAPTEEGRAAYRRLVPVARAVTEETLAPLSAGDRQKLLALLDKLV